MDYLFTLLEGIASFISPCMLPMLPIYISYFAGDGENKEKKALVNSIGFVTGFTIVFSILAVLVNYIGNTLITIINYAKIIFGVLIIVVGLNYMELIKIGLLNKSSSLNKRIENLNFIKSIVFGMLFSISWTPCVGAFLSSALLLVAKEQDLLKGILLIIVFSLGLGIPFIISAVLIDKLKGTFDFIKKHYDIIKKISGIILIVMGLYVMIA